MLKQLFSVMTIEIHKVWLNTQKLEKYGYMSMIQKGGGEINIVQKGKNFG